MHTDVEYGTPLTCILWAGEAGDHGAADADACSPAGRRSADGVQRPRSGHAGARR